MEKDALLFSILDVTFRFVSVMDLLTNMRQYFTLYKTPYVRSFSQVCSGQILQAKL